MNLIAKFGFIFLYICALYTDSILVISSKPEILSKFETIIEANDNHTILCQGNRPLEWKTPQVQEDKRFWTKFNIESIPPVNNSYKYSSKLEIINMSYPFIGFYSCHEISDTNDNEESASIYLYVNDPDQLTLLANDTRLEVFMIKYQEGVIPCKPTSPDVDVELFDYANGDKIPDVLLDNQILYRYDPLRGFITNTTECEKIFECSFHKNVTTQKAIVKLFIEEPISHLPIPFIQNSNQDRTAVGQNLTLKCVIKMIVDNKVYFHWKIPNGKENQYRISNDDEARMSTLTIYNATKSDSGTYFCNITDNQQHSSNYSLDVKIFDPETPQIINSTLQDEIQINLTDPLVLYCNASGLPKPVVTWYKNDVIFQPSETHRINISGNNEKIVFSPTIRQDEGTYKCVADNKNGTDQKQQTVKFKDLTHGDYSWLFVIVALLSLVLIGTIIFIVIKFRKEKQLQRELKSLGLANFQRGAVENINPELGIDEQAELLPYDQKWEFPIDQLKLGKQLGSGAFGVVMKGLARNIVEGEAETTVAVKMVKQNSDDIYIKALASELKIMVHLGKHLNVVNLLGACTKNVAKKELLVIVEFCRFGNLQHYLFKHRDYYIDQVDPKTCKIDCTIGQELFDRAYSESSDRSNDQSPLLKYAAIALSNITNTGSCSTSDAITLSQGEEGVVISNDSIQPDWRSNYRGDYKGTVKPICTKDLLVWAFQVARGMEYLASRKVLHGDLAARNILLAENNVIKICDFGLAKSMYENDNYKKKGNGPLPMKWMAIESLRDRVFSTQSDVWSFGIVLWELFSLARTPYPGMHADEKLYQKLLDGYRMEPPNYAPKEIYKMMLDCWSSTPLARPSFTMLSDRLGNIVGDALRNYYIDLNDPYLAMNIQRLENGQSDYLALLNSPIPEIPSSPDYVNKMVSEEPHEDTDYLSMRPNIIFSPRMEEDAVFSFNMNNRKHLSSKDNAMERLPMLSATSDSGYETAVQSPTIPNSFSNPSYHHMIPNVEKKEDSYATGKIMQSPANYINMGESKKKMMSQNNPVLDSNSEKSKQTFAAHCKSIKV